MDFNIIHTQTTTNSEDIKITATTTSNMTVNQGMMNKEVEIEESNLKCQEEIIRELQRHTYTNTYESRKKTTAIMIRMTMNQGTMNREPKIKASNLKSQEEINRELQHHTCRTSPRGVPPERGSFRVSRNGVVEESPPCC